MWTLADTPVLLCLSDDILIPVAGPARVFHLSQLRSPLGRGTAGVLSLSCRVHVHLFGHLPGVVQVPLAVLVAVRVHLPVERTRTVRSNILHWNSSMSSVRCVQSRIFQRPFQRGIRFATSVRILTLRSNLLHCTGCLLVMPRQTSWLTSTTVSLLPPQGGGRKRSQSYFPILVFGVAGFTGLKGRRWLCDRTNENVLVWQLGQNGRGAFVIGGQGPWGCRPLYCWSHVLDGLVDFYGQVHGSLVLSGGAHVEAAFCCHC